MAAHDTSPGVLIYNGKPYAVGLLWFTVQDEASKSLLQQRLKKTAADFYCQRQHVSLQQAFGWLDKGHRRGMPAAAAMVADQLVGEWHGVFEADNGWWYVQVRSDTLTPNGDRFFESEEDAFNIFQEEMGKHNWPHAYAPDKWRLSDRGIRELPLKNLLDDLTTTTLTPATITGIFGSASARNIAIGGFVATFAVMGLIIYVTSIAPPEIPVQRQARVPVAALLAAKKVVKTTEFISPQQLSHQCGLMADQLFQSLPGWKMGKFTCTSASVSMTWQQITGSLNEAKTLGFQRWPKNAVLSLANRSLTVRLPLEKLPTIVVEELLPQEQALLYLEQNLQPLGTLQVKPVVPPPPAAPRRQASRFSLENAPAPVVPAAPPPYLDITFNTGFAPERIAPLLRPNGLELVQAEWLIPQGTWSYRLKWTYEGANAAAKKGVKPNAPATPQNKIQGGQR